MPIQQIVEFLAVMVSAVYGILLATRKEMDVIGHIAVAFIVSFGGGTLRDLFLDRHPLFWIEHGHYPIVVFAMALVGSLIPAHVVRLERYLQIPDAIGLALFSVVGTDIALDHNTPLFVAAVIGVIGGTFGGVIADVVCNEVPSLFRPATTLYATCSFSGAWTYIGCRQLNLSEPYSLLAGAAVVFVLRMLAIRFNWRLPGGKMSTVTESVS